MAASETEEYEYAYSDEEEGEDDDDEYEEEEVSMDWNGAADNPNAAPMMQGKPTAAAATIALALFVERSQRSKIYPCIFSIKNCSFFFIFQMV